MSLYTRNGDTGFASTATRKSIPKNSPVFSLIGSLEELNSALGAARLSVHPDVGRIVRSLQQDVLAFQAELSGGAKFATREKVAEMEKSIDMIEKSVPEAPQEIPGDSESGACFAMAQAVARRAERWMVTCKDTGGIGRETLAWGNRLSDFIGAIARLAAANAPAPKDPAVKTPVPAVVPMAAAVPAAQPVQPAEGGSFLEKGLWLCRSVIAKAAGIPLPVVTAVCDAGGNAVAVLRADNAYIASVDIAENKAFTSVSLKMPTEDLGKLAAPGGPLYGIQHTNNGRIVIFGGGVPLHVQGTLAGGFGVSGGSAEQDTGLGRYAAEIFDQKYNR